MLWLDTGMRNYPFNNFSYQSFLIVLYIEQPPIDFRENFTIRDISDIISIPLLTKLCGTLRPRLVSFVGCFIVGSNNVDL